VSGFRWIVASRVVFEVIAFAGSIALARLVSPAEVGHAAVAVVFPMIAVILTFEGFGAALVQRKQVEERHFAAAAALSVATGVVLTVAVLALAGNLGVRLFGRETASLIRLVSPVFIVAGIGTVPRARLQRALDFRLISQFEVAAALAGLAISLTLAIVGLQAKALVLGAVGLMVLQAGLMLQTTGTPRFGLGRRYARDILAYGAFASLSGLAFSIRRNIDYFVLGATIPAAQVGYYYRAFQVAGEYQGKVSTTMMTVVFPLLSRSSSSGDMHALRGRVVRVNATILIPALALLVVIAPELIPAMYGSRWTPTVGPTRILAIAGIALALLSGADPVIMALGRSRALFAFNATFLITYVTVLLLVVPYGLTAICWAVVTVHVVMLGVCQECLMRRIAGLPWRHLLQDAGPGALASCGLLVTALPLAGLLRDQHVDVVIVTAACATTAVAVYVLILRVIFPAVWRDLADLVSSVAGRVRTHPVPITNAAPGATQ
jgi:O-antigen/teichoic acid export membrane protein